MGIYWYLDPGRELWFGLDHREISRLPAGRRIIWYLTGLSCRMGSSLDKLLDYVLIQTAMYSCSIAQKEFGRVRR